MKIRLKEIDIRANQRPSGYKEDLLAHGKINGEFLEISGDDYMKMRLKYSTTPIPSPVNCCGGKTPSSGSFPPILQQAKNAAMAAGRVAGAIIGGSKVLASEETVKTRETTCDGCEFKRENRCLKCGCQWKVKIRLATEKCPVGKW